MTDIGRRAKTAYAVDSSNAIDQLADHLRYVRLSQDFPVYANQQPWTDTAMRSFAEDKIYVVQTSTAVIERCILMATDPGDLVLDPTCGSGTTAYVAEQWGRRWITIDTSRVALALARARIMGARYPFYLLADSREGQIKEAEVTRTAPSSQPVHGNIRHGFVYERVPHITLKSIANNAEIDVIWDKWQAKLEPLRESLNAALKKDLAGMGDSARGRIQAWPDAGKKLHAEWWQARIARQQEIDASIAAKAEFEYLYDKPYDDKKKVRVAGPFTVESLSPHRVLGVDENDELIDTVEGRRCRIRREAVLSPDDPGKPQDRRRPAGAQGGPDHIHRTHAMARRFGLCRRPLHGRRNREARRHLHRSGVRHRPARRPRRCRPRGGRCRLRRADRLRLQLRGPHHGVQQAGPHPRAQGPHERRPAHGRRPQEHRQRKSVRHLRRAGHRP